ncbi:MAG: mechanosensitive ion channel protein MscS [Bacteroidetes bacterium]|nr:MAG: mechanosensitive ion channel protein MscS [Bacteroidota bacterium]
MKFLTDLKAVMLTYYDTFVAVLPRIVLGLVAFLIIFALAGRLQRLLKKRLLRTLDDPLLSDFIAQVLKVVLVILAILVAFTIMGLGGAASGILAGASVSAFIIGFAFKDIGENFLAGIIMAFDRPFQVGNWVAIGGHDGTIVGLSLRDVHLKTFDGRDVYIPNGMIVRNPIVNYTQDGFLRREFTVQLGKESDVDKASALVLETLATIEGVLQDDHQPSVFVSDYNANGLVLTIQFWLNTINPTISGLQVRNNVINRIIKGLLAGNFYLPAEVREMRTVNIER